MKLDRFVAERAARWSELERLEANAGSRPQRLSAPEVLELARLYRAAAADLALARRRWPRDPVTRRLEGLVSRGRVLVYESGSRKGSLIRFFVRTYWQRIRERPAMLIISALLLVGSGALSAVWASTDPLRARGFVPEEMQSVVEPRDPGEDLNLSAGERAAFSSFVYTNNIQVSFLAFGAGVATGFGTALLLLFNGTLIGAVAGLAIDAGNGVPFFELVTAHGVLELSCIIVTGAAGLRLGWAIVVPGQRRRLDALAAEGRPAIEIVLGTMPWLVVAGLVEGFITPAGLGLAAVVVIGCALGAIYWILVGLRGRPTAVPSPSP